MASLQLINSVLFIVDFTVSVESLLICFRLACQACLQVGGADIISPVMAGD